MLVVPPHVAARVVLSSLGEALLGFGAPRGTIGHTWLLAARSSRLVLGCATLHHVSRLQGSEWIRWESQAHSDNHKRAEQGGKDWYLWQFSEAKVFTRPLICPPLGQLKYISREQWERLATPEAVRDSPGLRAARAAAAEAILSLPSCWAGPGPGAPYAATEGTPSRKAKPRRASVPASREKAPAKRAVEQGVAAKTARKKQACAVGHQEPAQKKQKTGATPQAPSRAKLRAEAGGDSGRRAGGERRVGPGKRRR